MKPRVSIIIPHFERVELLLETLNSIRQQTNDEWEAIIVDDGSSSECWRAVEALADGNRVQALLRIDREKGPSACRNIGAEAATGDWLIFLDSDDLLAPWCLEQRVTAMQCALEDFLVFPVALFAQTIGDQTEQWNALNRPCPDLERFLNSDGPWHTSSPIWRKDAFLKIGGFNERVFYGDDSDLHTRALLAGLTYRKLEGSLTDAFVRRGNQARITSESGQRMVDNRRRRLHECTIALRKSNADPDLLLLWEGQYFVEAEFLLFNLPAPLAAVRQTLSDMKESFPKNSVRMTIVYLYFNLAIRCKARAYILVRVVRRLAMMLLPASYFAQPTPTDQRQMSASAQEEIRRQLAANKA